MNILERRIESQVQFWSLLGPFVILLSIAVLLFKVSAHWVFPMSALIGVPLCVKWKLKGMAAALACLFAFSTTAYFGLEVTERYWHVGMGLAIAFSFIVLTLSLEEVEGLIGQLQMESQSRLENFMRLDEKWKGLEQEWISEKEKVQIEAAALARDFTRVQEDKQTFYKLAQLAKDELLQIRTQYDQMLQELLYKKQQIAQLHERLEENEATIQGFVNSDVEQQIQKLSDHLSLVERDRELFKAQAQTLQNQVQSYQNEKEHLDKIIESLHEQEKIHQFNRSRDQQEKIEQNQAIEKLHATIHQLEKDQQTLLLDQANLKNQYDQVCQIEEQHRQTIHFHQHCVTEFEKKLAIQEQHNQTYQKHQVTLEASLQQQAQLLKEKEEKVIHLTQAVDRNNQTLFEKQGHVDSIQEQLNLLKQTLLNEQIVHEATKEKVQQLEQAVIDANQRFVNEQVGAQQVQKQALSLNQELNELKQSLEGEQLRTKMAHEQIQQLKEAKQRVEQRLIELITQLQQNQLALDEAKKQVIIQASSPVSENTPSKRYDALYLQLKDQFQEKSHVLEDTRRELFYTQEKLAALQKDQEEVQCFGISEEEQKLQRLLHQLNKQYDKMESIYQKEIHELYDLISHLFVK